MQTIQKSSGTIALATCGLSALLLAVAGVGSIVSHQPTKPATEQPTASTPATTETSLAKLNTFTVEYQESGKLPAVKSLLERSRVLEYTASALEKSLQFQPIVITAKDCSTEQSHLAGDSSITICYDLLNTYITKYQSRGVSPEQAAQNALYNVVFAVLHEAGHATIRQYQIPYTGSQEDAADEFAVVFATNLLPRGDRVVKSAIFAYTGNGASTAIDEHRADDERSAFLACRLYGSKPAQYQRLAAQTGMQSDRQEQCKGIYNQSVSSWNTFLKPHRKEG